MDRIAVSERDAASYLALSAHTLRMWRRRGCGPPYLRLGRAIRYRWDDLLAWAAARRVDPASPAGRS